MINKAKIAVFASAVVLMTAPYVMAEDVWKYNDMFKKSIVQPEDRYNGFKDPVQSVEDNVKEKIKAYMDSHQEVPVLYGCNCPS